MRQRRILMIAWSLILGLSLAAGSAPSLAQGPPDLEARVLITREASRLTLRPVCVTPGNAADGRDAAGVRKTGAWTYDFRVRHVGLSASTTTQRDSFMPVPGATTALSTTRIHAVPGDTLHLRLVIRRDDRILAATDSTFVVPPLVGLPFLLCNPFLRSCLAVHISS